MTETEIKYWKISAKENIGEMEIAIREIADSIEMLDRLIEALERRKK